MTNYAISLQNQATVSADSHAAYNFGNGDFTLETWVRGLSPGTVISRIGDSGGFQLGIEPDGTIKFGTGGGPIFYDVNTVQTPVIDGQWHHLAAVRKEGQLSVYVDGELVHSTVHTSAVPPGVVSKPAALQLDVSNSARLRMGATESPYQEPYNHFTGLLDEVRVWNVARDQSDIQSAMHDQLVGSEANLVGYWPADFDIVLDCSDTRNTTHRNGQVVLVTKASPTSTAYADPMLYLFAGAYTTGTSPGSSKSFKWSDSSPLYLTETGLVIYEERIINNPTISGNTIAWSADDNPHSAEITFKLGSDNADLWPEGTPEDDVFEGRLYQGRGYIDFRGLIFKQFSPSSFIQSAANGLVINGSPGTPGTSLTTEQLAADTHQQFCMTERGWLIHMNSRLAVTVPNNATTGVTPIILSPIDPDNPGQRWRAGPDGHIYSPLGSDLVLALSEMEAGASLVLQMKADGDPKQLWFSLFSHQFIWNNSETVGLDVSGNNPAPGTQVIGWPQKYTGTSNQLWYFAADYIVSDLNGLVIAPEGGQPRPGAKIVTAQMRPDAPEQHWQMNGRQILTRDGSLALELSGQDVILATPDASNPAQQWTVPDEGRWRPHTRRTIMHSLSAGAPATGNDVEYVISIQTSPMWFSGTDDRVEISLVGEFASTRLVELKQSETHANSFERGNVDRFRVTLEDVGHLKGIYVQYGNNTWFGGGRWNVDWIVVDDTSRHVQYRGEKLDIGWQGKQMPHRGTIFLDETPYQGDPGDQATLSVSMYPGQAYLVIYYDHTYVTADSSARPRTYFDAAGGHTGSPTTANILTVSASLNEAIRMATGHDPGPDHPWQEVYGHNEVTGKGTCGIWASGFRNRDGQCHQIVNRLLHVSPAKKTLADASTIPARYGLSCLLWGPYGVGFRQWCEDHQFTPPPGLREDAIFNHIRTASKIPASLSVAVTIYYFATIMRGARRDGATGWPDGETVRRFIRSLHDAGIDDTTIQNVTNLPASEIQHDEL